MIGTWTPRCTQVLHREGCFSDVLKESAKYSIFHHLSSLFNDAPGILAMPRSAAKLVLIVLSVTALFPSPFQAQGIECTVNVNYESVVNNNKEQLRDLASDIREYVNSFQWGTDNVPDKIPCTVDVFVQGVTGENTYLAQVFIGSQRPIFKSNRGTAVLRLKDDSWEFTYIKGRPLNHNHLQYNDFSTFLDFYMTLVVAFDADTYDNLGGTTFFARAADLSRLGRSNGSKGWQPATSGYSRSQFVDDVLLPNCSAIRQASYIYHFTGVDSLSINAQRAQDNILRAAEMVGKVRVETGTRNLAVKTFFDTKYMELAEVFRTNPDRNVYYRLANIDPNHQKTYEEYRVK